MAADEAVVADGVEVAPLPTPPDPQLVRANPAITTLAAERALLVTTSSIGREGGRAVNVHALLAVAVNAEGYREILGLQVSSAEDGAGCHRGHG